MSKEKNIWIINQYCGSRIHGMNFRSWYFANEMKKEGFHPHIITASFSHLLQKLPDVKGRFTFENVEGIDYTWVKVSKYTGSQSIGRVLVMIQFMLQLFLFPKKKLPKPDVIMVSSLSPFPVLNAFFWSRKYKAKLVFEVRDIWPLSLIEIGGMSTKHPLVLFFGWFEKFAYRKADKVISLLPNADEHMLNRGMKADKFMCIPNGFDPMEMEKIQGLPKDFIDKIPKDKFIVGYTGSIGAANAMEYFIEASKLLKDHQDIHFIMVGKGQHRERLEKDAGDNVSFLGAVDKNQVQSVLQYFDLCYIGWHNHSIYRFGISPNKVFDYMFSAKPILHSVKASNDIVDLAGAGKSVRPEDPKAIADAILELSKMEKTQLDTWGENGKTYVQEHHTYEQLTKKLLKEIYS